MPEADNSNQAATSDRGVVSSQSLQFSSIGSQSERVEERLDLRQMQMTPVDHEIIALADERDEIKAQDARGR